MPGKSKNWAWITTDLAASDEQWKQRFARMRQAGIDAILPEIFNNRSAAYRSHRLPVEGEWLERLLPLAGEAGLEVHAWCHLMTCNIEAVHHQHPEWFAVNRRGESTIEKPAYVGYYRFMCPAQPGVAPFLRERVAELAQYPGLTGFHLDYIRFPDVILASALQRHYQIVQDREYPEYDYCYCALCRHQFEAQTGIDPLKLEDPAANPEWRQFRHDLITRLVNQVLAPAARQGNKQVTAAVFPNWEHVRQEWPAWELDGFLPMLYHSFYDGDIAWVRQETERGIRSLKAGQPLYSGLFVPALNPPELAAAIVAARQGGAQGVALFSSGAMSEAHWEQCAAAVWS